MSTPEIPEAPEPAEPPETGAVAETAWERRRRLARVFGDVLPDTTGDERDPESGVAGERESAGDRWLKSQVPPHHG